MKSGNQINWKSIIFRLKRIDNILADDLNEKMSLWNSLVNIIASTLREYTLENLEHKKKPYGY